METLIMSYFTFQHICKSLKLQNLNQTSQLLSEINIQDIYLIEFDSDVPSFKFERAYKMPDDLISFKTFKKLKNVPSLEIKKYVLPIIMINIIFVSLM